MMLLSFSFVKGSMLQQRGKGSPSRAEIPQLCANHFSAGCFGGCQKSRQREFRLMPWGRGGWGGVGVGERYLPSKGHRELRIVV